MEFKAGHTYLGYQVGDYYSESLREFNILKESATSFFIEVTDEKGTYIGWGSDGGEEIRNKYSSRQEWVKKQQLIPDQKDLQVNNNIRATKYGGQVPHTTSTDAPIMWIVIEDLTETSKTPVDNPEPKTINDSHKENQVHNINEAYSNSEEQVSNNVPQREEQDVAA